MSFIFNSVSVIRVHFCAPVMTTSTLPLRLRP